MVINSYKFSFDVFLIFGYKSYCKRFRYSKTKKEKREINSLWRLCMNTTRKIWPREAVNRLTDTERPFWVRSLDKWLWFIAQSHYYGNHISTILSKFRILTFPFQNKKLFNTLSKNIIFYLKQGTCNFLFHWLWYTDFFFKKMYYNL